MTINDIIASLISSNEDILLVLRKSKVLAVGIGNKDFITWINSELNGYNSGENLPEYRRLSVALQATISNGYYTHNNQLLSIALLPKKIQEKLNLREFIGGIGDLLEMSKSDKEYITFGVDPAFNIYLDELISSEGLYQITAVYNHIQLSRIKGIIHQVGNKLLDFLLGLREIINPDEDIIKIPSIKDATSKERIHSLAQQIFYGPVSMNGVNQVGSTGNITINYTQELINKGVHEDDIKKLKEIALIQDNDERQEKKEGWIKKVSVYLPTITTMVDFIDTAMEAFL